MLDVKLPNVRKLFIPDPGYVICDCDLSGADAQVVAWDAGDEPLKRAFREGLNVHNFNGETVWGKDYDPKGKRPGARFGMRDEVKRAVHGTNYGASARTVAITLGWKVAQAEDFQSRWFRAHPAILNWHRRIEQEVQVKRTVTNAFGYRRVYFDRADNLLPQALAWIPQSTVGIVCFRGAVALDRDIPWCQVLLQVHDSVVFQIPFAHVRVSSLELIKRTLTQVVPYPDPLTIPWELAMSDKSWGDCEKKTWEGADV